MQIKKLKVGQAYKYKELCEVLKIDYKSGKSKQLQLQDLERYFKYNKEGTKIIIDEIYKRPKTKIDNRKGGNNKVYTDDIEKLILNIIYNQTQEDINKLTINLSTNQLLTTLNIVNNNYKEGRKNIAELSKHLKIDKEFIYEFFNVTSTELKKKLERGLNSMRKQFLIKYSKSINIHIEKVIIERNLVGDPLLDDKGNVLYTKIIEHREATDDEKKLILLTERKVLESMYLKDTQDAFVSGNWDRFKKKVAKELKKHTGIEYYYETYKIIYNSSDIIREFEKHNIQEIKANLNSKVVESFKIGNLTRHENSKEKHGWGKRIKAIDELRASDEYLKTQDILIENLLSTDARQIDFEKLKTKRKSTKKSI